MKKIYFALAVLGAATLVSCVKDIEENNPLSPVGKNTLAFRINGGATTRAGEEADAITRGVTIPLGNAVNGPSFSMVETVVELDATAPVTRGTPAYTENVGVLYKNNLAVYSPDGSFGTATLETMDSDQIESGGWRYQHTYPSDPWPTGTAHFYLRMPATQVGVTSYSYPTEGSISFEYTSPLTAAEQQDILFAYTALTKGEHNDFLPNGAPVLFNHALTGVKFAIGNDADEISYNPEDNKIAIKEISFKGLKDKGTCVITPVNSGTHVSAAAAVWNPNTLDTVRDSLSSGTYADTVHFKSGESFGANGGSYPDSFVAEGTGLHNLNDAAATQTFWLIPQEISADVELTIKYTFAGKDSYWSIDLGSILAGVKWKAGQIRTYTIKVDDVNVKIADTVTPNSKENQPLTTLSGEPILKPNGDPYLYTYYGGIKNNLTITNTGNTDTYLRAALIGQWLDEDGNPVFGFTDYTAGRVVLVDSWYQDQFVSHQGKHGFFVNLPGYKNINKDTQCKNPLNGWFLAEDGYYYYTSIVPAGQNVPQPLFTSYTVDKNPAVVVAGKVKDVYFTLEIATQAVSAKNSTGGDVTLSEAWSKAGVSVTVPASE